MSVSLRKAINAKCKDCIYDPRNGGNWREQVESCAVRLCPLWEVRPLTEATRKAGKPAWIRPIGWIPPSERK